MQKLYLNYPEIKEINANIVSRRSNGEETQVILDRTIFMPKDQNFLDDKGYISDLEIISVEEKRDNIIHTIKGKPQKSAVRLRLDDKNRIKNLTYNTAYIIFKLVFQSFYQAKDIKLNLVDNKFLISISEFYDLIDKSLIEEQINFVISKAIIIENKNGITSIYPIGELINNNICFDNTSKVRGFKIKEIINKANDLEIEFIAGSDLLKYWWHKAIFFCTLFIHIYFFPLICYNKKDFKRKEKKNEYINNRKKRIKS